ncbi:hypothetical protein [Bradyrhizobium sp. Arg237L]|uniref:hypothetical protein n=1 Tax=Bradyrhizobium sp. Arg237L TaxID=3003352 RepID=UPI0032B747B4
MAVMGIAVMDIVATGILTGAGATATATATGTVGTGVAGEAGLAGCHKACVVGESELQAYQSESLWFPNLRHH